MVCGCRVVYGTLLGPEATGPGWFRGSLCGWCGAGSGLFVSGFLAAPIACVLSFGGFVWGVWFGVVV